MTSPSVPDEIFRAYDIRGIVGRGLNREVMTLIGQAIGSEALDQGEGNLVLAADARLSSPEFTTALQAGILSTGCDVTFIGVVPTPLMYFAIHTLGIKSGVMITGSHNPKNYNGIKIVLKQQCLSDDQITRLKERIQHQQLHTGKGNLHTRDIRDEYLARICEDITLKHSLKVVIDAGNGVAGSIAPGLFTALGCEVVPLFCEPDGNFPNHHPDPTVAKNLAQLIETVINTKADIGLAFDGDGDRIGLVSNAGHIIDADKIMMSFINDILPDNPAAKVVFDVKSSQNLERLILAQHGEPIMCKSGHSFVKKKMQESGALLGGEFSAHIFLKHRWYGFDDGLYVAARFLELMDKHACSSDALLNKLPTSINTPELQIEVEEAEKFSLMEYLQANMHFTDARINSLDGIRVQFPHGWGLVRASNTTPKLTLRFEADSESALNSIIQIFKQELLRLLPGLTIDF